MARMEEAATFEKRDDEVIERHPSYGMIGISRISGGHDNLFGSSISHQNYIELRIKRATRRRNLNTDWYYAEQMPLVSVKLSPTQFAELITTMNVGDGVPCTLDNVGPEMMPACPERHLRQEVKDKFKEDMREMAADIGKAKSMVDALLEPGTIKKSDVRDLAGTLHSVLTALSSNIPFAHECFDEACDKTVGEAKGEIDAAFTGVIARLGGQKLQELLSMDSAPDPALTLDLPAPDTNIVHETGRDQSED